VTRRHATIAAVALGCCLGSCLLAVPAAAQTGPQNALVGEPVEEDVMRYPPSKVRTGLILGGGAIFGVSYGLSAMSASLWPEVPGSEWLYAPIIGPWGALALNDCSEDEVTGVPGTDCDAILAFRYIMYILDGFVQAGGVGMIGEAIFMTTEADEPPTKDQDEASVHFEIAPVVTGNYAGFGVVGTF
jgi:hypothetical protein